MRDLGERGLEPLPVTVRADPHLEPAVRREARVALLESRHERDAPGGIDAGAVAGLLGVHRKADADATSVRLAFRLARADLVDADRLDRAAAALRG